MTTSPDDSDKHNQPHRGLGQSIGGALDRAVGSVGHILVSTLTLPGLHRRNGHHFRHTKRTPGSMAGIDTMPDIHIPPDPEAIRISCIDYSDDRMETTDVDDLEAFLSQSRPEWVRMRWVNVYGLHPWVVNQFKEAYGIHTLSAEDILHTPQRPKIEQYDQNLFIVARMMRLENLKLVSEQISFFLSKGLLVTFQEFPGDVWQPIRERIQNPHSRVRKHNVGYLTYALLDAMVDHMFPLLEAYGNMLEEIEAVVLDDPDKHVLTRIHAIKRELVTLRRMIWPLREVVDTLYRQEHPLISTTTRTYLRDVHDHAVQVIDIIEIFREMASSITELYMSAVSNRMNEVMKVLTIMASLFIPITFLAGVYGMNFDHFPELHWRYAYPVFWGICAAVIGGLLIYFKRKKWL